MNKLYNIDICYACDSRISSSFFFVSPLKSIEGARFPVIGSFVRSGLFPARSAPFRAPPACLLVQRFSCSFPRAGWRRCGYRDVLITGGRCVLRPTIKCSFTFNLLYSNTLLRRKVLTPYFIIEPFRICETQMFVQLGDGVSSACYKLLTPISPFALGGYFPQDDRTNT